MLSKLIRSNWKSGLTVALISIPLSISLAVASGVSPVAGIITAMWAGFVGSLCGGSHYNIIGPTGALSGIIAASALTHGPEQVSSLALLAGLFIGVAYLCRLERYVMLIPSTVIHGFTLGVACIIALNQLNFALGLQNLPKHESFFLSLRETTMHLGESSLNTFLCFIFFLGALVMLRKIIPLIPGAIIVSPFGIALGYYATRGTAPFSLETLGSTFGAITPQFIQIPHYTVHLNLLIPALTIALIAIIETLLSAKIADRMTHTKHNPHTELRGLAFANIVSGLVGGIPATAALARTALNIKTGATDRVSGALSSIFIAIGSLLFLSSFSFMPMAVIAAMLVYVALNMIEREHFEQLWLYDKRGFWIALLVAAICVYADPIVGIIVGTIVSFFLRPTD